MMTCVGLWILVPVSLFIVLIVMEDDGITH